MPTEEEWEGMGRKVDMKVAGMTMKDTPGYQAGYDDGLSEGERRGWELGKEAAARLIALEAAQTEAERSVLRHSGGLPWKVDCMLQGIAAAIRKLKKP